MLNLGNRRPSTIIPHVHHKTKRLELALAFLVTLVFVLSAQAQTLQERHGKIRSAIDSTNLDAALAELDASRNSNAALFAANNYDYLLGRLQEKKRDITRASASYQAVITRNSLLSSYALWRLSQLARSTGDLNLERERLRRLIAMTPPGFLRDTASMRLGQSFMESKDYLAAVDALRVPADSSKSTSLSRQALALMGEALLKGGKSDQSRDIFRRILMQMPDASRPDDYALSAVRALDSLERENPNPSPGQSQLSEAEHLLRASVYQFNRDFDTARSHYVAVVDRYPQSPTVANALYQTGRGYYLQGEYEESLKYFLRVGEQFPESTSAREALIFSASTYNRLKRTDDAIATYKRYIERYPDIPNPELPYLNLIDALHEAGRHQEALTWAQEAQKRFQGKLGEALAVFAKLRVHLAQGSWAAVIDDTTELRKSADLGGVRVPSGTTSSEVSFLRAYALERLGRFDAAASEYLSIPDGRNEYYGRRATQRLLAMAGEAGTRSLIEQRAGALRIAAEKAINGGQPEEARKQAQNALRITRDQALRNETLELVTRAYDALPAYKLPTFILLPLGRQLVLETGTGNGAALNPSEASMAHQLVADELFFLGLYDEAIPEFAAAQSLSKTIAGNEPAAKIAPVSQADLDYSLAVYALRGGLANRSVRFGEQVWRRIPQDYVMELAPRNLIDLLYPLPYRDSALEHAASRAVDPRLVIAIARQESRFQADAKSVAAARGLMQFIPATANDIAGQLQLRDFAQDQLYNSDTAILFGSQYLANLFQQFPAQPQAVAASYNGGPHNMARWMARSQSNEPDRYVPEIGFSQTKDYVFKVMTNFWIYEQLYDEKLQRK